MDLWSRTQDYGCASCYGESDLMSSQALAGSGSAWYKQTAKAMDSLSQGLSKTGRNLTTKKQRKEIFDVGIDAARQKVNPQGAAIEQFDDLYLTGAGHCGDDDIMMHNDPKTQPKVALAGKGLGKKLEKVGKKVGSALKPDKETTDNMIKGAAAGAVSGAIGGAAAGAPAGGIGAVPGAAIGGAAGAVGGAAGAYTAGKV